MPQKPHTGTERMRWSAVLPLLAGFLSVADWVSRRLQGVPWALLRLARGGGRAGRDSKAPPSSGQGKTDAVQAFKQVTRCASDQEAELHRANLRFETALSNMSQGLCLYDADDRLDVVNQQFFDIYHLDPIRVRPGVLFRDVLQISIDAGNYPGRNADELLAERQIFVNRRVPGVVLQTLGDGRIVAISHSPMQDGGWVATYEDVTARRTAEAQVVHMARHDALTALPNRVVLHERLEHAVSEAGRGTGSAVLCLDLDHFKAVNDTLGHPVGDGLLRLAAERLMACVRQGDLVVRLDGDEFAIVQADVGRPEEARLLAERIVGALQQPFVVEGHEIVTGVSIGLAIVPGDGTTAAILLKNADMALHRAKQDGRGGFCFFEPEMDRRLQRRRNLELDLRRGVLAEEFVLFYQPLVNLDRNEVSGFEALLRWPHPERGMVSPSEFIPVAEEIGVIVALGEWVIRRACADAALWPGDIKVAVNLSPVQFRSRNLVPTVVAALAESGLAPWRLELEITESVLLQDNAATLAVLHELRALGARISMDDFGTGYSSLSYLRSFPFDKLKIDQAFVRDLSTREDCVHIVRAVQGLCAGLGIATVAEGVETEGQLARLRAEGCKEVQGFLFSHARCVADVPGILRRINGGPKQNALMLTAAE